MPNEQHINAKSSAVVQINRDKELTKKSRQDTVKVRGTALLENRDEEGEVHLLIEEWEHGLTYFRVLVVWFEAVC